jgi:hypothetical protein
METELLYPEGTHMSPLSTSRVPPFGARHHFPPNDARLYGAAFGTIFCFGASLLTGGGDDDSGEGPGEGSPGSGMHGIVAVQVALGLVAWTLFYWLAWRLAEDVPRGDWLLGSGEEASTRGQTYVSLFHQCLICPAFVLAIIGLRYDALVDGTYWSSSFGSSSSYALERHVFLSIIGYELKDFKDGCIHWQWILHHSLAIGGAFFSLFFPAGAGYLTINALNAEIGSGVFNLYTLSPTLIPFILFQVIMLASNSYAAWTAFAALPAVAAIPTAFLVVYGILTGLLVPFRTAGQVLTALEFCRTPATEVVEVNPNNPNEPVVQVV